ncbi:MAG: lipoprotein insertase outer membrane protein LolB [Candidatus Symbiodolus clandestinus]
MLAEKKPYLISKEDACQPIKALPNRRLPTGFLIATVSVLFGLLACSSKFPKYPTLTREVYQQQRQQLTQYQLRGSLVLRTPRCSRYARFNWQQQAPDHYQLRLTHPLGQTLLLIQYRAGLLQLVDHRGDCYQGEQAKQLIQQHSGFRWPMTNLASWLIGLPGPQDRTQYDQQQQLQALCPHDYPSLQIHYRNYRQQAHLMLPSQLKLLFQDQQITLNITYFERLSPN